MGRDITSAVVQAAISHGDRPALVVDGKTLTYSELVERARRIAGALAKSARPGFGAVMGTRTANCFAGLLGVLFSGAAYVPLSPTFPTIRTATMLRLSGATSLVIESSELEQVLGVLADLPSMTVLVTDIDDVSSFASRSSAHHFIGAAEIFACEPAEPRASEPADMAYLMFTSGSTGSPKGVMVSHGNVMACVKSFSERFAITPEDRFSQNFELTFDLSVFDMFMCWTNGACLFVPAPAQRACPNKLVVEAALTVWFSVPSLALFMRQMRTLRPGAFPSLRLGLFCGERLSAGVAKAWSEASPNAKVENLYGPTEVTIACTTHAFDPVESPDAFQSVPIGKPLPGLEAAIVNDDLSRVATGEQGELCFAGTQVALGYWRDPEITQQRFVTMPWQESGAVWYRTGDLARMREDGVYEHLGRLDDQVKIRGYRIELGEVEIALRKLLGTEAVAAVAVPASDGERLEIVAFVESGGYDERRIREGLGSAIPAYMHPARFLTIEQLPLNSNGKIDRRKLRQRYEETA